MTQNYFLPVRSSLMGIIAEYDIGHFLRADENHVSG
jgi:hypothetical protein